MACCATGAGRAKTRLEGALQNPDLAGELDPEHVAVAGGELAIEDDGQRLVADRVVQSNRAQLRAAAARAER